jgi:hypothetical protein
MFRRIASFTLNLARRLFRSQPPERPYAEVLVPVGRGPRPRSGAIALEEPQEPRLTDLQANRRSY